PIVPPTFVFLGDPAPLVPLAPLGTLLLVTCSSGLTGSGSPREAPSCRGCLLSGDLGDLQCAGDLPPGSVCLFVSISGLFLFLFLEASSVFIGRFKNDPAALLSSCSHHVSNEKTQRGEVNCSWTSAIERSDLLERRLTISFKSCSLRSPADSRAICFLKAWGLLHFRGFWGPVQSLGGGTCLCDGSPVSLHPHSCPSAALTTVCGTRSQASYVHPQRGPRLGPRQNVFAKVSLLLGPQVPPLRERDSPCGGIRKLQGKESILGPGTPDQRPVPGGAWQRRQSPGTEQLLRWLCVSQDQLKTSDAWVSCFFLSTSCLCLFLVGRGLGILRRES
uniref:Uncharacterized protein LOC123619573 n=1 Tax=Camelus bactrianus TaxID=9837 RepID=A0A9W3GJ39_CAMBA